MNIESPYGGGATSILDGIFTLEFKYMLQSRLSFVIYGNDFIGRHQLLWVSISRELSARCCCWYNFYGSVFPAAGINIRAWTFEYGKVWIWVEHWSLEPVLFYGTITAFGPAKPFRPRAKKGEDVMKNRKL